MHGKALLMNKLTCKSLQTYCEIDLIKQALDDNLGRGPQHTAAAARQEYVSLRQLAHRTGLSPPPVPTFGFQMAYNTGHWTVPILTVLPVPSQPGWSPQQFSSTELWQPMPSLFPQNLIPAQSPLFFTSFLVSSDSLRWPFLATEMKTLWCCICKFLE